MDWQKVHCKNVLLTSFVPPPPKHGSNCRTEGCVRSTFDYFSIKYFNNRGKQMGCYLLFALTPLNKETTRFHFVWSLVSLGGGGRGELLKQSEIHGNFSHDFRFPASLLISESVKRGVIFELFFPFKKKKRREKKQAEIPDDDKCRLNGAAQQNTSGLLLPSCSHRRERNVTVIYSHEKSK